MVTKAGKTVKPIREHRIGCGSVLAVLAFFFLLLTCFDCASASTIGTTTDGEVTRFVYQRRCFYANGRFWVFYTDGTNLVFSTSTDNVSWASSTSVRTCIDGRKFSVWFDGTYFHYAYCLGNSGSDLLYRRGTPNSDGTVTWSAVEQTAYVAPLGQYLTYPAIAVDSSGYAWIAYRYSADNTNWYPYIIKSGNNNGTWGTTPGGFPYSLSSTAASVWRPHCVPLTSQKMAAIYGRAAGINVKIWNGSGWSAEETPASSANSGNYISTVADGDDVYFVYPTATTYDISCQKRTYGSSSWGSCGTVQSSTTLTTAPALSIDASTGNLTCYWTGTPSTNHIYFKKYSGGSWDSSPTDLMDESSDGFLDNNRITSFYQKFDSYFGLVYMVKSVSPYDVRFIPMYPTAVGLQRFEALQHGNTILLKWRTGYEVDNLGFHIYREENGERYKVTPELIAGSAFLTGTGTPLTAGRSYTWIDASAAADVQGALTLKDQPFGLRGAAFGLEAVTSNLKSRQGRDDPQANEVRGPQAQRSAVYYLEDWDLNGKKTMHGPISPVRSEKPLAKYGNAALLSNLGKRQNQKYDEFWRIQELRERLQRTAALGLRTGPPGLEEQPFGLRGAAFGLEAVALSEAILK
jgi:hypothetical protein